jgi:hypothetical protein
MHCESIVVELVGYGVLNAIGVEPVTEAALLAVYLDVPLGDVEIRRG